MPLCIASNSYTATNAEFKLHVEDYLQRNIMPSTAITSTLTDGKDDSEDDSEDEDEDEDDDSDPTKIWVTNHEEARDADVCEETRQRLKAQDTGKGINDYWRFQYSKKAGSYWHRFYKHHSDKFFKNRHYLHLVFPDLLKGSSAEQCERERLNLLEVGCGVGNAVWHMLELNHNLHVTAMDFAKSAIDIVKQHPAYRDLTARTTEHAASSTSSVRIEAFHVCLVTGLLPTPSDSQHLVLCMFVLSAIAPENLQTALNKLANVLKPGGKLLIRDYAKYDEAQLRFSNTSKIQDNFYVRNDGTCSYFFDVPFLRTLCETAKLKCIECHYINKRDVNRQQQKERNRIWIHGVFQKE